MGSKKKSLDAGLDRGHRIQNFLVWSAWVLCLDVCLAESAACYSHVAMVHPVEVAEHLSDDGREVVPPWIVLVAVA